MQRSVLIHMLRHVQYIVCDLWGRCIYNWGDINLGHQDSSAYADLHAYTEEDRLTDHGLNTLTKESVLL